MLAFCWSVVCLAFYRDTTMPWCLSLQYLLTTLTHHMIILSAFEPDFIKSLIATNKWLQAIRYIHALDLRDRFPITALIDNHLAHWNKIADDRYKGPNVSDHLQVTNNFLCLCSPPILVTSLVRNQFIIYLLSNKIGCLNLLVGDWCR